MELERDRHGLSAAVNRIEIERALHPPQCRASRFRKLVLAFCPAARCRSQFDGDCPAFFPFAKNMSILSEHERDNLRDNDGVVHPNAVPLCP